MKNKTLALLISLILIAACKNSGTKQSDSEPDSLNANSPSENIIQAIPPLEPGDFNITDRAFGETIELFGEPVNIPEKIKPYQLFIKNNYLITYNQRTDSLFMIFRYPDMECVASFGVNGRGPDEFQYPRIIETMEDSILFYVYEMFTDKLYKVPERTLKPEYYLTLPKQDRSLGDKMSVFITSRMAYYPMSTAKGKSVFTFNADSVPQEKLFLDLAISGLKGSWTTYIGDFGVNATQNRMAYAYKYFKRMKVVDLNLKTERNIIFKSEELTEGQSDIANLEPTNITHYWGMSANRDFFWMLYSGRTPVDVQHDNRNGNKYIFVEKFDWNGNPVKRFRLDDWGYFCVTPDNKTLLLASTAGVNALVRYRLPE